MTPPDLEDVRARPVLAVAGVDDAPLEVIDVHRRGGRCAVEEEAQAGGPARAVVGHRHVVPRARCDRHGRLDLDRVVGEDVVQRGRERAALVQDQLPAPVAVEEAAAVRDERPARVLLEPEPDRIREGLVALELAEPLVGGGLVGEVDRTQLDVAVADEAQRLPVVPVHDLRHPILVALQARRDPGRVREDELLARLLFLAGRQRHRHAGVERQVGDEPLHLEPRAGRPWQRRARARPRTRPRSAHRRRRGRRRADAWPRRAPRASPARRRP